MVRSLLVALALLATAACGDKVAGEAEPGSTPRPGAREKPLDAGPELDSDLARKAEAAARDQVKGTSNGDGGPRYGADVSWPQCPKGMGIPEKRTQGQPMPTDAAEFVVLGLTNGPSFTPNPCLADQVEWVRERGLKVAAYSVTSFPDRQTIAQLKDEGPFDGSTRLGALRNVGYQAALFNLDTMEQAGLESPVVWIDVEPVAHFEWSDDEVANSAVVEGVARGYTEQGKEIGYYSTPMLWEIVVGEARFGGPEWRAAGETSEREALRRCRDDWSFQGGTAVMGQWVEDDRDRNVICPGVKDAARWFHQY